MKTEIIKIKGGWDDVVNRCRATVGKNVTYERVDAAADTVREVYEDIMALFEED